jgi:hypothetical protein
MGWGLIADGILAVLLMVTIGYCGLVHRRLGAIRKAEHAMRGLADDLNAATARAESGLNQLRATAAEAAEGFDPLMREARSLAGDLDMLCHRARKLADRLDRPATPAEAPVRANSPPKKPVKTAPVERLPATRSRSERALLEALKAAR